MPWRLPTQVLVEDGALGRLGSEVRALAVGSALSGAARALLVVDPGLAGTPWPELAEQSLVAAGWAVAVDSGLEPNPRTTTAERLGERARELGTDLVVAVGGGSALDAAKAAAMLATNPRPVTELVGRERFRVAPLPFVACPTTCGTGSEVTWVSVLSDTTSRRKVSVKGLGMFPRLALVDPTALETLPSPLVAATAMDALTHALEATTCRVANAVSDALAEQAIHLLFRSLPVFFDDPHDAVARHEVALASTVAGMAFGNADVATVHCLSEAIGGILDLPHGLLNAVLLVPTLRFEGAAIHTRLARLEAGLGNSTTSSELGAAAFLMRLEQLGERIGLPSAATLGLDVGLWPEIAAAAAANGSNSSSPRPMSSESYLELLGTLG